MKEPRTPARTPGFVRYRAAFGDRDGYLPAIGGEVAQLVPYATADQAEEAAATLIRRREERAKAHGHIQR